APAVSVRRPVVEGELRRGLGERPNPLLEATNRPIEEEGVGPADVDLDQLPLELGAEGRPVPRQDVAEIVVLLHEAHRLRVDLARLLVPDAAWVPVRAHG